jgi:hypothetical protein
MKTIRQISLETRWNENQLHAAVSAARLPAGDFNEAEVVLILAKAEELFADATPHPGEEWIRSDRGGMDIEG